jgi:hypothetical protein
MNSDQPLAHQQGGDEDGDKMGVRESATTGSALKQRRLTGPLAAAVRVGGAAAIGARQNVRGNGVEGGGTYARNLRWYARIRTYAALVQCGYVRIRTYTAVTRRLHENTDDDATLPTTSGKDGQRQRERSREVCREYACIQQ